MGSIKVNITCGGEKMEVQQLKIEPQNWHHRFEISVNSEMLNGKNIINIEMKEIIPSELNSENPDELIKEPLSAARSTPKTNPVTETGQTTLSPQPSRTPPTTQVPQTPNTNQLIPSPKVKEETFGQENNETVDGSVWL